MHKNVRLPIAYHVIGHPEFYAQKFCLSKPMNKFMTGGKRVNMNVTAVLCLEHGILAKILLVTI